MTPRKFWSSTRPVAIAHRGGDAAGLGKRNTLEAFRAANKLGYHYIETDVTDTKDGQVIVSHGASTRLGAYLSGTFTYKTLRNLTYKEVRRQLRADGQPIPLLEEVLKAMPDTKFLIDPKTDSVVEPLAALIARRSSTANILINSFSEQRLERLQQLLGSKVKLGLIIGRDLSASKKLSRLRRNKLSSLDSVSIHHWLLSKQVCAQAHRQGLFVIAWTPNTRRAMNRAVRWGADGIISDSITLLKSVLSGTKQG